jgi:catechol 2,3-dioxygenase-like lactoylglutathione lyase family enzyme
MPGVGRKARRSPHDTGRDFRHLTLFIVSHVPSSLSFYRDRLGFEIDFQGPDPDDIFFGIVRRGGAQILLKDVGVAPLPNYTRDVKKRFRPLGRIWR